MAECSRNPSVAVTLCRQAMEYNSRHLVAEFAGVLCEHTTHIGTCQLHVPVPFHCTADDHTMSCAVA